MTAAKGEASVHIDADPQTVYEMVADVTRMGEWSPETHTCVWVGGATGPEVGARFKAKNKRGWMRWSNKPTVVAAEPGKEFAFSRKAPGSEVVWRYEMEADGSGTKLTESYDVVKPGPAFLDKVIDKMIGVEDRGADLVEGMQQTIERVKAAAEAERAAG